MENNKTLYKSFTRLAIHTAMKGGVELQDARDLIYESFNHHPYAKKIKKYASKVDYDKYQELEPLLANSVIVCEDFGPDRDYLALVLILEKVNSQSMRTREVKEDKLQIVAFIVSGNSDRFASFPAMSLKIICYRANSIYRII